MPQPHPHIHQPAEVHPTESPISTEELDLPNPNGSVEDEDQGQLDERSLNVLAAREISKQMGVSGTPLSPPSLPFAGRKSVSPRPSFTTSIPPSNKNDGSGQILPLPPQSTNSTEIRDVTPTPDSIVVDDGYHTPPEYLRNFSTPPSPSMNPASPLQVQIPHMSPTLPSQSTPTTAKKITAAAFRRPKMQGSLNVNVRGDSLRQDSLSVGFRPNAGRSPNREGGESEKVTGIPENTITPLNLRKKSLPSVPGPTTSFLSGSPDQGAPRSVSSPFPNLGTSEEQRRSGGPMPPLSNSPESRPRESVFGGEEEFDYVSAYMDEGERRDSTIHN